MQIEAWWRQWPNANIGVSCCGSKSLVYDIDVRHGGHRVWAELITGHELPQTPQALTGSGDGSRHVWFAAPREMLEMGLSPVEHAGLHVKFRGYVVVPPSIHPCGKEYQWIISPWNVDFAPLPTWLNVPGKLPPNHCFDLSIAEKTSWYGEVAIRSECEVIARAIEGERNTTLNRAAFKLGQLVAGGEIVAHDAIKSMLEAAEVCGLTPAEALATIRSGMNGGAKDPRGTISVSPDDVDISGIVAPASSPTEPREPSPAPKSGFFLIHIAELRTPVPVHWLIEGLIETHSLVQLHGASGSGKSFLALAWSWSIAHGVPWQGRKTNPGAVYYLAGEGHRGICRRLAAWEATREDAAAPQVPWYLSSCAADLTRNAQAVGDLIAATNHAPIAAIFIDTLARNLGAGDENSAQDVGTFVRAADYLRTRFSCSVIVVHHTGHATQDRARGSSALPAAVDMDFSLQITEHGLRRLTCRKAKDADPPAPILLRLVSVPLPAAWSAGSEHGEHMETSSGVLVEADAPRASSDAPVRGHALVALDALAITMQREPVPTPPSVLTEMGFLAPRFVVSETSWHARAENMGLHDASTSAENSRKRWARAKQALLERGMITIWGEFAWPTSAGVVDTDEMQ